MANASGADIPASSPRPAIDHRWPDRVEPTSPTLIELLRRLPSDPAEAEPDNSMNDDADDGLGVARGLTVGVLIGSGMWGAVGLIVWLLLDW
jgi:hypothetical protein